MHKPFTTEEDRYITDNYLLKPMKQIAKELKRSSYGTAYRAKHVLKLVVPPEIVKQFKKQFKKGHVPFVKGKKQEDFLTVEQIENFKQYHFKKGELPKNALYDGAITIRINKASGIPYKWIRMDGKWQQLSRYNWLKAGKEIPEGFILVFKTPDTMNCDVENLECISRAQNLQRNREEYFFMPPSIRFNEDIKSSIRKKRIEKRNHASQTAREEIKHAMQIKTMQVIAREAREAINISAEQTRINRKKVITQITNIEKAKAKKQLHRIIDEKNWSKKFLSSSKIKIADTSNLIPVRINHKTTLYLKPGTDIEKVKQQYSSLSNLKYA